MNNLPQLKVRPKRSAPVVRTIIGVIAALGLIMDIIALITGRTIWAGYVVTRNAHPVVYWWQVIISAAVLAAIFVLVVRRPRAG